MAAQPPPPSPGLWRRWLITIHLVRSSKYWFIKGFSIGAMWHVVKYEWAVRQRGDRSGDRAPLRLLPPPRGRPERPPSGVLHTSRSSSRIVQRRLQLLCVRASEVEREFVSFSSQPLGAVLRLGQISWAANQVSRQLNDSIYLKTDSWLLFKLLFNHFISSTQFLITRGVQKYQPPDIIGRERDYKIRKYRDQKNK